VPCRLPEASQRLNEAARVLKRGGAQKSVRQASATSAVRLRAARAQFSEEQIRNATGCVFEKVLDEVPKLRISDVPLFGFRRLVLADAQVASSR
jgi:ubiquinone/menaquinone biosynthesis C-methylase UbiE